MTPTNQTKSTWKVTAIIFIVLFVLSWAFFLYVTKIGIDELNKEEQCRADVCIGYDGFYYANGICYCYNGHEIAKTKRME